MGVTDGCPVEGLEPVNWVGWEQDRNEEGRTDACS
jgi:hypothetical protein